MSEDNFTPDQAILVAKAAGLDVTDLEQQVKRQASGDTVRELSERIDTLEARLRGTQGSQDPARAFAKALDDAQSQWYSVGGSGPGGDDAAA